MKFFNLINTIDKAFKIIESLASIKNIKLLTSNKRVLEVSGLSRLFGDEIRYT